MTWPHVRADEDEGPLARLCLMLGVEPLTLLAASELHLPGNALVFLNGQLLGVHRWV
jgi:DNA-directed RNA polymerase III subunit RPC2